MFALRCLRAPLRLAARPRFISSTVVRRAEVPQVPGFDAAAFDKLQSSTLFQKLQQNPTALAAVVNFAQVMQKQGIDPSKGPPSMLQMSKLFLVAEVREAAKTLGEEFQKAGLDLKDKNVMAELAELSKLSKGFPQN